MINFQFSPLLNILVGIFGGLAIFLFAMQMLSQNLQNVVGDQAEKILRKLTDRPSSGMVVGTLITFLTQSSSITVLTLIGLVNVGVLNLNQGMGVLLGAGIGTTITAQLVTLEIGKLYFPILAVSFFLPLIIKNEKFESWGKLVFSFGLLFMGMALMKEGARPISQSDLTLSFFEKFATNPFLGILVGAGFTAITSSSSATTSLVVALGASGVIGLPSAVALIMGANVGTTVLEFIAALGMSLTAKRIAVAQALINIIGVGAMLPFIKPFADLMELSSSHLANQIANSHTVFNVGSSMVFLLFVGVLVRIVKWLVPGEVVQLERKVKFIDEGFLKMPSVALINAEKETGRMGKMVSKNFDYFKKIISNKESHLTETVFAQEVCIDDVYQQVAEYLTKISSRELNLEMSERVTRLMHGITDIERPGDHLNHATEQVSIMRKKRIKLTKKDIKSLVVFVDQCQMFYRKSLQTYLSGDQERAQNLLKTWNKIKLGRQRCARQGKTFTSKKRKIWLKIVYNLERTAHHGENLVNIVISGF